MGGRIGFHVDDPLDFATTCVDLGATLTCRWYRLF